MTEENKEGDEREEEAVKVCLTIPEGGNRMAVISPVVPVSIAEAAKALILANALF